MFKSLSLYDYNLSELNNLPNIEYLIINNLNIDIEPNTINLPMSLKAIIIKKIKHQICIITTDEILYFIKNLKMPYGCKLTLYTRIDEMDYTTFKDMVCLFIYNKLHIHKITKNNYTLMILRNKFNDLITKIKKLR